MGAALETPNSFRPNPIRLDHHPRDAHRKTDHRKTPTPKDRIDVGSIVVCSNLKKGFKDLSKLT